MTRSLNLLGGFLLAGALAFAQTTSPDSGQPAQGSAGTQTQQDQANQAQPDIQDQGVANQAQPDIQEYNFTGCLTNASGNFIVVAEDGQIYKLNTQSSLEQYVGKKISVGSHTNTSFVPSTGITGTPAQIPVEVDYVRAVAGDCPGSGESTRSDAATGAAATSEGSDKAAEAAAEPVETPTGQQPSNAGSMRAGSTSADEQARGTANQAEDGAQSAADNVQSGAETAAGTVERGAENAAGAVESGAEATAGAAREGAEQTGEAVAEGAQAAGNAVERGAERAGINDRDADTATTQSDVANQQEQTMAQARPQAPESGDQGAMLPQTASPLPLIALLGLGSLLGGVSARRRKK
jgi:LPXTG-motif cell wall-anchored protein